MQSLHSWLMYQVHGVRPPRRRREPRRGPDQAEAYRDWIRQQPSAVSESTRNVEACHTGPHGFGQKSSGYTCIPLTHEEHMELHRIGPRQFQEKYGIDFEVRKRLPWNSRIWLWPKSTRRCRITTSIRRRLRRIWLTSNPGRSSGSNSSGPRQIANEPNPWRPPRWKWELSFENPFRRRAVGSWVSCPELSPHRVVVHLRVQGGGEM